VRINKITHFALQIFGLEYRVTNCVISSLFTVISWYGDSPKPVWSMHACQILQIFGFIKGKPKENYTINKSSVIACFWYFLIYKLKYQLMEYVNFESSDWFHIVYLLVEYPLSYLNTIIWNGKLTAVLEYLTTKCMLY